MQLLNGHFFNSLRAAPQGLEKTLHGGMRINHKSEANVADDSVCWSEATSC